MESCREGEKFDIHQLPPSYKVGIRETAEFLNLVAGDSALRDKLKQAERFTGKQHMATAMLYGRNDRGDNVAREKEINHSEKILKEKRRMLGL